MDCSLPDSSVHGILQARILEWIAIPFSRGSSEPRDQTWISCIVGRLFTVWAIREAPMPTWYFIWAYEVVVSEKCLNLVLVSASRLLFEDKHVCPVWNTILRSSRVARKGFQNAKKDSSLFQYWENFSKGKVYSPPIAVTLSDTFYRQDIRNTGGWASLSSD